MEEVGGNKRFGTWLTDTPVINLPHTGKYKIYFGRNMQDTPTVNITDTGLTIYRYKEPNIIRTYRQHMLPAYISCGKLADGFVEDFYPSGHIRQRGDFYKGDIRDTLVRYFENGKINTRTTFGRTRADIEEFDSLGVKRRTSGFINPGSMYFSGNDTTLYFRNGKIQKNKMISAEGFVFLDEYYPDGKLKVIQGKNSRVEYFESGEKRAEYNWMADREFRDEFNITKKIYNKKRQKIRELKYNSYASNSREFNVHAAKSDFLEYDIRYKNGRQISIVKDLDMDKAESKLKYCME